MAEVRFYHLLTTPLEQALPGVLEKVLARGWKAVVRVGSAERLQVLNQHLWTFRADSFLPHGAAVDGDADLQPIWLTLGTDNPNGATVLVLTDGTAEADITGYDMVCDFFDGSDADVLSAARARWKMLKQSGHSLTYWQQTEHGWQKMAEG